MKSRRAGIFDCMNDEDFRQRYPDLLILDPAAFLQEIARQGQPSLPRHRSPSSLQEQGQRDYRGILPVSRCWPVIPARRDHRSPEAAEKHRSLGLVLVEGPNDVIRLDILGVPAVALCSNRISREQTAKVARLARELAGGIVTVFLDCDPGAPGKRA